ncbi:MAG: hypothetical protein H6906_06720 [Hyphomicrobiales bacterium]|nr:hypothetical protein [Hyphomicrobiales bacterium]
MPAAIAKPESSPRRRIAAVRDLLDLARRDLGTDRADDLGAAVLAHLPPDQQRALLGGAPPRALPMGVRVAEAGARDADTAPGGGAVKPPAGTTVGNPAPAPAAAGPSPVQPPAAAPSQAAPLSDNDRDAYETPMVLDPEITPEMAEQMLERQVKMGRKFGLKHAPDYLDHYLHGQGKDMIIPRDEARKRDFVRQAEAKNRKRFDESFLNPNHQRTGKLLTTLQDGHKVDLDDKWDYSVGPVGPKDPLLEGDLSHSHLAQGRIDEALATGQSNINSDGDFTAVRHGDIIYIEGTVTHVWKDRYDFEKGKFGADLPLKAKEGGKGHDYNIRAVWQQKVSGSFKISNGRLSEPELVWRDIDPKGPKP